MAIFYLWPSVNAVSKGTREAVPAKTTDAVSTETTEKADGSTIDSEKRKVANFVPPEIDCIVDEVWNKAEIIIPEYG